MQLSSASVKRVGKKITTYQDEKGGGKYSLTRFTRTETVLHQI